MSHAIFSPSAAHRWMVCAPSIAAPGGSRSREAAEGSVAHDMASTCLQTELDAHQVWLSVPMATYDGFDIPITQEMRGYVQRYIDYVRGLGGALTVERKLTATPEFAGTADAIVLDGGTLHVVDFKYGKGVRVDVEGNKQMLCYAVLALIEYGELVEFDKIVLHVHQPRMDNIAAWATTPAEVEGFKLGLYQAMTRAMHFLNQEPLPGLLDYVPGDHCKFCSLAATCPGLREHAMAKAQKVFGTAAEVPQSTLAEVLREAEAIDAWIAAVRKEAMERAMRGETIDGFKLVWKRPMRKWTDEEKVRDLALDNLITPWMPAALRSPADIEKEVGREAFKQVFGPMVKSVSSGLALVAESDKRQRVDDPAAAAAINAAEMFQPQSDIKE